MPQVLYRATLTLHTPLGTPLAGDTLFGQLCWALRESKGEPALVQALQGYTEGKPWLVVSDGFPAGFLPKPTLPSIFAPKLDDAAQRKAAKKQRWIPASNLAFLTTGQLPTTVDDKAAYGDKQTPQREPVSHNSINRLSGTTGEEGFAPYTSAQTFHAQGQAIDLYLVHDDGLTTADELHTLLTHVGQMGFGRDASVGLGKFTVTTMEKLNIPDAPKANAFWTLAPCAPQGQGFDGQKSYWRVLTRFGRHGNVHALSGKPFKTPVLLAATGAVLTPANGFEPKLFIGQGLGGKGELSKAEPTTVHQGYAPVLPLVLGEKGAV